MENMKIIRPLGVAFLTATVLAFTACDTILKVNNPGAVTEEGLAGDEAIGVLIASAQGSLADAFDQYVLLTGLFSDELTHTGSFTDYARADIGASVTNDWLAEFQDMSTARFLGDLAVERVRAAEGASDAELAEALAYAGWSRILLAESMCEVTIAGGPIQSPDAVMQAAADLLGEAIQAAQAGGDDDILNLARVGRARVRLWLGDNGGAAADAGAVPADFVFELVYAATANANNVAIFTTERRETGIEMPFWNIESIPQCSEHPAAAPHVEPCPFETEGEFGPDNESPLFVQLLYPTRDTELPLATGTMAAWYEMEAQGVADPFEQAVALFLTGNRQAQMRRQNHPYFQGRQSCWIMPEREEDTNPNI